MGERFFSHTNSQMYLKRLDIQGFKSFPEKIKLEFNLGISAVVGPNGSGKSNISDAVRFVLGEQSAKTLRGAKMEDVIFSGTASRRPLGFAEVSVTIDNSDYKIPLEYSEITVTRRAFRSGEGEYMINGVSCRLKDVHELFMDTGIGKEGYSIIGQGRIDEILNSKSDDRRLLFEEAAGIVKFKNRKHEAEQKLERERQNLVRVNDIIVELETQLLPLMEQAETAKKYLYLSERMKLIDVNLFVIEADRMEKEIGLLVSSIDILGTDFENIKVESDNVRHLIRETKEKLTETEEQSEKLNEGLTELRLLVDKNESAIELFEEQVAHMNLDVRRLNKEINLHNDKKDKLGAEKTVYMSRLNSLEMQVRSVTEQINDKQRQFDSINVALKENETQIDYYKTELIEKIKAETGMKARLNQYSSVLREYVDRKRIIDKEKSFAYSQINDQKIHVQSLYKTKSDCTEAVLTAENEILAISAEKDAVVVAIENTNKELNQLNVSLGEKKSRYKILKEMEKDHEGYFNSVKSILRLKETGAPQWKGICGAIGELIVVMEKYETAIEVALGNAVQNIVTQDENDAKAAIMYLKQKNGGRATFLPLSAISARDITSNREALLAEEGVVGIAQDLISFDEVYSPVMSSLLGRVFVIDNVDNAILFSKKYKQSFKIVTLDGELLNIGGSITGGSINSKTSNIFGRSREIKELSAVISDLEIRVVECTSEINSLGNRLGGLQTLVDTKNIEIKELNLKISEVSQNIYHSEMQLKQLDETINDLAIESEQLQKQHIQTNRDIEAIENEIKEVDKEIDFIQTTLDSFQSNIQLDRETREMLAVSITDLKVNISSSEQNIKAQKENIDRVNNEISVTNEQIESNTKEIGKYENNQVEKVAQIEATRKQIFTQKQKISDVQKDILALSELKNSELKKLRENEAKQMELSELSTSISNELVKQENKKEKLVWDRNRIFDDMWEQYEITYQSAKKFEKLDFSANELHQEQRTIKNEIKEMGNVYVGAIDEYKSLRDRLDFLSSQRNDIVDAESKLKIVIEDLLRLMETQFKEQLKIISNNFNSVFTELFGGGQAHLRLSDESDALNSGIDIIAQPPGKSLQSMSLLSGGERALTAIALLFAILKMKPSPFCILDEIEAALDDANVKRYADYLLKYSKETQFIIVTHRKGTMEVAHVLYGVTMQEHGVSKLVSVKFTDV